MTGDDKPWPGYTPQAQAYEIATRPCPIGECGHLRSAHDADGFCQEDDCYCGDGLVLIAGVLYDAETLEEAQ